MARIHKLTLSGIRSFGPEEEDKQFIKFQSPLTLFLGQNGCGKTTIIEALKFACTGELPPGCKTGQGFIYDPKLANKSSVMAQVKLKVLCPTGEEVVVIKSINATQKPNKTEFKRLESVLARQKPGHPQVSVSGRCIDVDLEVCASMGVSKAILNNVVFCHQEDSAWPLDEPKKLKERFDAIFDATKYNKCIESMRALRKKRMGTHRVMAETVKGLEYKKTEVEKKKNMLQESERKLGETIEQISGCEERMKPMQERLEEIKQIEKDYDMKSRNLQMKKQRYDELKKDIKQMSNGLKILEHSDTELADTISEFEKLLKLKQDELTETEAKLKEKITEEKAFLKTLSSEQQTLAQLDNEKKRNETQKTKRDKLITPLATQLELTDLEDITDTEKAKVVFERIEAKIEERKAAHEKLIADIDVEDQELQANIDKCRGNKIAMDENAKSKMKQLKETKAEVKKKKKEVEEANANSSHLEILKGKLERNAKEYDSLMESLNPEELQKQIDEETTKRDEAEKQLEALDKEVKTLQIYSNVQTELDLNKENRIKLETDVESLRSKHLDALNHLFNNAIPETALKAPLDKLKREFAAKIRELNASIKKAQKKVTEGESDLKHRNEKLAALERELETSEKNLQEQCENKPLQEVLTETNTILEKLQKDKGNYSNSKFMYGRFIEKLEEEDPCCPICRRDFADQQPEFIKNIITDIKTQIEDFPNKITEIDKLLAEKQKYYNKMVKLETVDARIKELKEELIPKTKKEIEELEGSLKERKEELETFQKNLEAPQESQEKVQSVGGDVGVLDKSNKELEKVKAKIADLEEQMGKATTSSRTLQEALTEQEKVKDEMTTARRQVDSFQKRMNNFNEQKQYLQETKNSLVQQQLKVEKLMQGAVQTQERFAELQATESRLSTEVAILDSEMIPVKKELDAAIDKKAAAKKENKKKVDKSSAELLSLQKEFQNLKNVQTAIDEFEAKNIIGQLAELSEKITQLETEKETHAKEKSDIQKEVDRIKNFLVSQENYRRELIENQRLREKQTEETAVKTEMDEISTTMQKETFTAAVKERKKLNDQLSSARMEKSKAEGRKEELESSIASAQKELAKESNSKAEQNYITKYAELKIREKALEDLSKFVTAVDHAIMVFHTDKMVQINESIRRLWRKIYRGNDVDYIEIKPELSSGGGKDNRRTFNYRVVQIKNGVELDMRARCSAGQKVLACLIIRMALAEAFSSNCGILTLDEPTTNLDEQNIKSLCEALVDIVRERKDNKNFQLIVITHDGDFLEQLNAVERLDSYYLLSRNREGKSVVRETVAE